ncbi:MAG TPA: hypothetical protein DCF63_03665 [Planctomycetaceae bacterium]|nr:hypothetical protein [Planctomycetaceae bacterium]
MKIKKLCDLNKKEIEKHFAQVAMIVQSPLYVCRQCCRVANCQKHLCKPTELPGSLVAESAPMPEIQHVTTS